jgi:hypothetical protein
LLLLADFVTHHVGGRNVETALQRVVASFPDAKNVYLSGDSAGGYAVMLNYWRFAAAFPRAQVAVLNDSGPPLTPRADLWTAWKNAWRLFVPPGCTTCDRLDGYLEHNAALAPDLRFGLVSFADDPSIASYFGLSAAEFATQMNSLLERMPRLGKNHKYFILPGSAHLALLTWRPDGGAPPDAGVERAPPALKRWVRQMIEKDPAWDNVR